MIQLAPAIPVLKWLYDLIWAKKENERLKKENATLRRRLKKLEKKWLAQVNKN